MKLTIIAVIIGVALIVGGQWLANNSQQQVATEEIEGVQLTTITERGHVITDVEYPHTPPIGGQHAASWLGCNGNIYDEPVRKENAVHSLEHGAVWITYKDDVSSDQVDILKQNTKTYTFLSPYPEQEAPIMLSAWGVQLSLDSADDPRLKQFLSKYRQGPQTPEPGATCNAIPGGMG